MVEWVVVVVVLAVVATIVFGPNGVLTDAVKSGINKTSDIMTALPIDYVGPQGAPSLAQLLYADARETISTCARRTVWEGVGRWMPRIRKMLHIGTDSEATPRRC